MSAVLVEAIVEGIRRRNPVLGRWAEVAADGLTAGEGKEVLRQAVVQDFLWYRLPAKYPDETWLPIARAAAVLLERLGLDRYASIARSETTTTVLESWREGRARGLSRYHAAAGASGVKPPDTDLLAWSWVMGMDEISAYALVESQLEEAIVAGEFVPGAPGWKSRAASLTGQALRTLAQHGGGRTWQQLVRSGYLPPPIVRDGVERFGWWDWPGQPRSETDVHQFGAFRETAARLRLVSKRGRRLATSRRGVALLADPAGLWRSIAATIGATDEYAALLSELIAHRLLDGPAVDDELAESIRAIVAAQGWRSGGRPVDERQIRMSIHWPLYFWRLFGLLDEIRPPWRDGHPTGQNVTSLTAAGRATALEYLRARATAPRRSLRT